MNVNGVADVDDHVDVNANDPDAEHVAVAGHGVVAEDDPVDEGIGTQLQAWSRDTIVMLSFQRMDVYRCAVEFLSFAHAPSAQASRGNAPMFDQLRRAATSIPLNIGEAAGRTGNADSARAYSIARGSAMECGAVLDALLAVDVIPAASHDKGIQLVERMVAMLTKLCR